MADVIIRRKPLVAKKTIVEDVIETSFFDDGYFEEIESSESSHFFPDGYLVSSFVEKPTQYDAQPSPPVSKESTQISPSYDSASGEEELGEDDVVLDDTLFTICSFSNSNKDDVETAFDRFVLDEDFDDGLSAIAEEDLLTTFDLPEKKQDSTQGTFDFSPAWLEEIDFDFDFEEEPQTIEKTVVEYGGVKDLEDVASGFAVRLVTEFDLDLADYDTLFSLFLESSYEQTAIAISNGFSLGLSTEEISLAAQLKGWWRHRTDFMTKIERITKRGDYSSKISRKILSWNQAFKIVQAFEGCPTLDELEIFVEGLFEFWNSYRTLQREFKSFQGFLLHMCSATQKTQWMIPNYTTTLFQEEILSLCRSWYSIDDVETRSQIKAHIGNWGRI